MNKHQAIREWLLKCPDIKDLFFNFGQENDEKTIVIPESLDGDTVVKEFLDGSRLMFYDFAIVQFKQLSTLPNDETNINTMIDSVKVADWIKMQEIEKNYPRFPNDCKILEISVLQGDMVAGIDLGTAKYMVQFRIEYLKEK